MAEPPHEPVNEKAQARATFTTSWLSRHFLQPLLICLSVISLFTGVVAISRSLGGSPVWMRFAWLFALVALEGIYTTIWLNQPHRQNMDKLTYRLAELLVIILLVRVFTWTISGTWPRLRWLQNYLLTPLVLISDPLFVIGLVLAILAWLRAIGLSQLFAGLAIDHAEANYYTMPVANREPGNRPMPIDRGQLVIAFFQKWIIGAFVLIICTAITTFNLSELAANDFQSTTERLALQPEILTSLLVYFLSGLFLLSHARLAAMNARWLIGGIAKSSRVERSWHRSNWWLITIVALVAAFLPLGSTVGASQILQAAIGIVFAIVNNLMSLLIALLSFLFPQRTDRITATERIDPLPRSRPASLPPVEADPLLAMVLSSLFWAVAIVVTVAAVGLFLRERGVPINIQLFQRAWRDILTWFRSLWRDITTQADLIRRSMRRQRRPEEETEPTGKPSRWRLLRINALSPRDQLRYFYLSTVRRAGEQGVKRQKSETPLEYAQDLKTSWPQVETEVDSITTAFVRARYSLDEVERQETNSVRQTWKRIKSRLRRQKRIASSEDGSGSGEPPG